MRFTLAACLAAGCSSAAPTTSIANSSGHTERRTRPTLAEATEAVRALQLATPFLTDQPADIDAALSRLGTPLWFDGFSYASIDDDDLRKRCTRSAGTLYERRELELFAECLAIADWGHGAANDELGGLAIAELPSVFAQHRARLGELATDHVLAYGHFCPAAPGDFWTLFVAGKDAKGTVLIDAILVHNEDEADCRTADDPAMR
jgi:hypothetical protein